MSRPSLRELRHDVFELLDDEWRTPSELCDALGFAHGLDWYRISLVCERLANDGLIEIQARGNRRKFRRGERDPDWRRLEWWER